MTCLIKSTTTSVSSLVVSIPWLMLLLRHASNKKQQEKTTDPTACGSFSCGSNQTYFTPSVAPARDRHTCGRQENKSNMSFDANAQPWLGPSGDLNCYPPLELVTMLITMARPLRDLNWNLNVTWSKAQGPLGLNWLGMEFQEFSSETLVS